MITTCLRSPTRSPMPKLLRRCRCRLGGVTRCWAVFGTTPTAYVLHEHRSANGDDGLIEIQHTAAEKEAVNPAKATGAGSIADGHRSRSARAEVDWLTTSMGMRPRAKCPRSVQRGDMNSALLAASTGQRARFGVQCSRGRSEELQPYTRKKSSGKCGTVSFLCSAGRCRASSFFFCQRSAAPAGLSWRTPAF